MYFTAGTFFGGFVAVAVLTAIILHVILRKYRNTLLGVFLAGAIALTIMTLLGGYGFQDEAPNPLFLEAFMTYFVPLLAVMVIELSLLTKRIRKHVRNRE